jgi:hypothetical protein
VGICRLIRPDFGAGISAIAAIISYVLCSQLHHFSLARTPIQISWVCPERPRPSGLAAGDLGRVVGKERKTRVQVGVRVSDQLAGALV